MMAKVESSAIVGIDAKRITVEVDIAGGLPSFSVVGLPDAAVRESSSRVRSAIKNCGLHFPDERITVNLSPASIRKEGPSFDLPIALGILAASGKLNKESMKGNVFCGELSLDGNIMPVYGALSRALKLKEYKRSRRLFLPKENAPEAAVVKEIEAYGVEHLSEVIRFLQGELRLRPAEIRLDELWNGNGHYEIDFADVKGQQHIKRGLEIACAGGHNIVMIGPPGAGKTMLAKRIPTILSDITLEEALETTRVHSVAGKLTGRKFLIAERPFRAPHHTISYAGLVGGDKNPKPGEISLAHNGVLFLDELPEFNRNVIEALRQPLEEGSITLCRASGSVQYPARFMLIASMNPCPCGFYADPRRECRCTPGQIQKYLRKISGPLMDRIDIHLEVPNLDYQTLTGKAKQETSETIRGRVNQARQIQKRRYVDNGAFWNARLDVREIEKYCLLASEAKEILRLAVSELGFSARAYDKILKVGRTIADLAASETITSEHISEAVSYRCLDRNNWVM